MVMLGALIGSSILPLERDLVKDTIAKSTKQAFLDSNLKAFDLGFAAAAAG
jgi:indolepyruvate ferredoxin oxidoreductase beta subunit